MRTSPRHTVDLARFTAWVPIEIRYSDLDTQGHVNNAVYFTYFEHARVRFLSALRERVRDELRREPLESDEAWQAAAEDLPFVVATASCVYRRPITGLDPVTVGVRCESASRASLDLAYAICDHPHGQLFATGATTIVSVDPVTRRPRSLPRWAVRAAAETSRQDA